MDSPPLVVDLDGTLLRSDLLLENGLLFIKHRPVEMLLPFVWLLGGKANLKTKLASKVELNVNDLPYEQEVIKYIESEKSKGRKIILATASCRSHAEKVAEKIGLFDEVFATESNHNLSSTNKRNKLVEKYGDHGFDYMGNSRADFKVWASARKAIVVNPERGVLSGARKLANVEQVIETRGRFAKSWIKELRFHQWVKNLLIFVPLLASHKITDISLLMNGFLAFIFFGLCASSVYLLNDLLDLADDRGHPKKQYRPFASGDLSIKSGLYLIPVLLSCSFIGAYYFINKEFLLALCVYYLLTLIYSFYLKQKMTVDVVALAFLYTLRIIAGTLAFALVPTFWMLAFSIFIFLSLALMKRYAELVDARKEGKIEKTRGRGYYPNDLEMISSMGASSGYISVLILALYIQDHATVTLYSVPEIIWLACPLLLFWISRVWLLTHRGEMHEDPIVFAMKDKVSILVGVLFGLTFWLAT